VHHQQCLRSPRGMGDFGFASCKIEIEAYRLQIDFLKSHAGPAAAGGAGLEKFIADGKLKVNGAVCNW